MTGMVSSPLGHWAPPPPVPPPPPAWTEEQKARYCGFVTTKGVVDLEAFRIAIEAPWRQR